jgi:hypothetical protein
MSGPTRAFVARASGVRCDSALSSVGKAAASAGLRREDGDGPLLVALPLGGDPQRAPGHFDLPSPLSMIAVRFGTHLATGRHVRSAPLWRTPTDCTVWRTLEGDG